MQQNILRSSNVTKIYLIYVENGGVKRKYEVTVRFMDAEGVYFATESMINFVKPKKKTPVILNVYSEDGVYDTEVSLLDVEVGIREMLFKTTAPIDWKYTQSRTSSRKQIEMPILIKYNDGFEIKTTSNDLSLGGISFLSKTPISSVYQKVPCTITIQFPEDCDVDFKDGKLMTQGKFLREISDLDKYFDNTLFVYKFTAMSDSDAEILKKFLLDIK